MLTEDLIKVESPAEVLRSEDGVFQVTSPYGHIFEVHCRRGYKMNVREISEPKRPVTNAGILWRIRRVREASKFLL